MKMHPMPPVPPEIALRMTELAALGTTQADLLQGMRDAGLNITDCMRLIVSIYGMSRTEAKILVHESRAWASMRGEYDAFHDVAEAAANKAVFLDVTDLQKAS